MISKGAGGEDRSVGWNSGNNISASGVIDFEIYDLSSGYLEIPA
jgi:hypothetical protein